MHTVNLPGQFAKFNGHCSPRVIGELNDYHVKTVKLKGEFAWHHHDNEDEMFLVVKCTLGMKLRDREAIVNEGAFIVVPRGVQHMPVADEAVHILLLEPKTALNTGYVVKERTVSQRERI